MTIPMVTRLEDWRFALYDLATCTKTVLNPDMIIDPQVEVVPGVGMERLKSCTFEIPFLADARAAFDFDSPQLLCIDRWGDHDLLLWGVVQKPKEGYSSRVKRDSVQVTAASVEELLKARKAVQYAGGVALPFSATAYPDDFAKMMVTACFTGNDLDGNSRAWEWGTLVVDADASECADTADLIVLSGNEQDDTLYKHLDDLARAYDFDFQLQVTIVGGAFVFTFKTQAPYGGSDLTTGASRVTIKDLYNLVPNATRYRDATYRATRMYTRGYLLNVEDAAEIAKWGVWEGVAEGVKLSDAEIALEKARVKQGAEYGYEATGANGQMALWGKDFKAGDKVNRINNRLGIAADSEKIAGVTARFQNKVMAVTIRWGDREPGATDRQSGGAYNPTEEYGTVVKDALPVGNANSAGVDPTHEVYGDHIHALLPTAGDGKYATITAGAFTITGSDGIATSIIDGKLVISGAALSPLAHTHAHNDLTGVTADQHHAGFIGLTIGATNIDPNASDRITLVAGDYIALTPAAGQLTIAASGLVPTTRTVTAGAGLTGGGALSGNITLNVGAGDGITVNADDVALTTPGTLTAVTTNNAAGNHTHAITTTTVGAASTIVATDADGYITAARFAITANEYLDSHSAAGYLDYMANTWHIFSIGGTGQVRIGAAVFRALANNTVALGATSYRWSAIYGVNGDLTGTLEVDDTATFNKTSTAIICQGNITMGSGKTVDGVDISAHKHDYRKVEDNGLDDTDGVKTSTWTPTGTPWWNTNYLRRSSDGTKIFLANSAFNTTGGTGYTEVSIGASKHTHYVGYSDTADTSAPV